MDYIHGQVPLIHLLVDLGSSIEEKLSQSSHRLSSHLLAFIFERIHEAWDYSVFQDVRVDDCGVPDH